MVYKPYNKWGINMGKALRPTSTPTAYPTVRVRSSSCGEGDDLLSASYPESGKMKFTVRRYDSVPNGEDSRLPPTDLRASPFDDVDLGEGLNSTSSTLNTTDGGKPDRRGVAERGRIYARRHKRRLVFKDGECNISLSHVRQRKRRYLGDMFTTMMDIKWRYNLLLFSLAFVVSWLGFGFLWWVIAYAHGDFDHLGEEDYQPCIGNVEGFVTALLFSIETQHTIGYGFRVMEPKCPEAIILLMIQSCFGVFIQSMLTGIIFAKLSRPKGRAHTIMFSKVAVICQRDGEFCLLFRVADVRKSHIVGASVRASLIRNRITKEGEVLPLCQFALDVQPENCTSDGPLLLVWPVTIIHKIDKSSPFWEMSAGELLTEPFEIIVFMEGTVESTGMTTQVRTSYLPGEILWGHRLAQLMTYAKENGQYKIDYTAFHTTAPVPTPECSAKDFAEGQSSGQGLPRRPNGVGTYHTEMLGLKPGDPGYFRNSRLHQRRNTELISPISMIPEERESGKDGGLKQKVRPSWMNGFVKRRLSIPVSPKTTLDIPEDPIGESTP